MAYSVQADVDYALDELYTNQLTDDLLGQAADSDTVDRAISDADGLIDTYLSARYAVPLTTVHASVRRASVVIAIYYMHQRRSWTMHENLKDAYTEAINWLKDVGKGAADIPGATLAPTITPSWQCDTRAYTGTNSTTTGTLNGF